MTLLIISAIIFIFLSAADVHSSHINNAFPQISESNRFFRTLTGRCNIPKLIAWKIVLFATISAAVFFVARLEDGLKFSFLVFLMMSVITLPTVLKNYKLHRKYSR